MQSQIPSVETFQKSLDSLGIEAKVVSSEEVPPLCRYQVRLDPKTRFSKLEGMSEDIALSMKSIAPPIIRPEYNSGTVVVEMMFDTHPLVEFSESFSKRLDLNLPVLLGTTNITEPLFIDLVKMPHLIVAGSTGSGKSMLLHSIIQSLLMVGQDVGIKLSLVDPKLVEFDRYTKSPLLLYPVVNDYEMAIDMLKDLRDEMNERYRCFQKYKCRDILEYREKVKKIPYVVLIIDELADLMKVKGFEKLLCELAQKSRAAGIHIIAATQHPSSKVLTAEVRANFPSKISCKVTTQVHSRVVLDRAGAENLLGKGDAILIDESGATYRFRGAFVPNNPIVKPVAASAVAKASKKPFAESVAGFFRKKIN